MSLQVQINPNFANGIIYAEKTAVGLFEKVAEGSLSTAFISDLDSFRAVSIINNSTYSAQYFNSGWTGGDVSSDCLSLVSCKYNRSYTALWQYYGVLQEGILLSITDVYGYHEGPTSSYRHKANTATAFRHTGTRNSDWFFLGWKIEISSAIDAGKCLISDGYSTQSSTIYNFTTKEYRDGIYAVILNCILKQGYTAGQISVTAQYVRKVSITISYSLNGGMGTNVPPPEVVTTGDDFTLPEMGSDWAKTVNQIKYRAVGWNTDPTGNGTHYDAGEEIQSIYAVNTTLYVEWAQIYTITFSLNGGTGTVPASIEIVSGEELTFPEMTETWEKDSYAPISWNTKADGTGSKYKGGETAKIITDTNITFYLQWAPVIEISFNKNGGEGPNINKIISISGLDTAILPVPDGWVKNGDRAYVWCTNSSGTGIVYAFGQRISVARTMTLYAIYGSTANRTTYFIYANGATAYGSRGGGIKSNRCIGAGSSWSSGIPVYYSLSITYINAQGSWYYYYPSVAGATGGTTEVPTITSSGNYSTLQYQYSVFGKTSPNSLTSGNIQYVYYSNNTIASGMAGDPSDVTAAVHTRRTRNEITASSATFGNVQLTTYAYACFSATTEGDAELTVAFTVSTEDILSFRDSYTVPSGDLFTFYGFHTSNCSVSIPSKIHRETFGQNTVEYVFIGWYINGISNGENLSLSFSGAGIQNNSIIEARYVQNIFIVIYDANGGTIEPPDKIYKTVSYGSTYGALPTPVFTAVSNASFDGWYLEPTFNTRIYSSTTVSKTEDHTLYAKWANIRQTVYFAGNGGTPSYSSKEYAVGSPYGSLPTCSSSTGRIFDGWYTDITGGDKVTTQTTATLAIVILYAHWTAVPYTVNYTLNGGTIDGSRPTSAIVGDSFLVPNPTRANYTFTGWTVTAGLNTSTAKYGETSNPATSITSSSMKCLIQGTTGVWFLNLRNSEGSITLTANWTGAEFQLSVVDTKPNGSVTVRPTNLVFGTKNNNSIGTLSRTGYSFSGYWDSKDTSGSNVKVYDSAGLNLASAYWTAAYSSGTFRGSSNMTVYGRYTAQAYDIGYDNLFHYYGWVRSSSRSLAVTPTDASLVTSSWWNADLIINSGQGTHVYTKYGNSSSYYNIAVEPSTKYKFYCTTSGTSTDSNVYYVELKSDYSYVKSSSPYYTTLTPRGGPGNNTAEFTTSSSCAYLQLFFDVHDTGAQMSFSNIRLCKSIPYGDVSVSAVRKPYNYNDENEKIGSLIIPTRSGYFFVGWYTAETGGTLIDADSLVSTVGLNRTLYSRWASSARTVTFDANGGNGTMSPQTVPNNTATALKSNSFTRTNCDFLGWAESPSDVVKYQDGASITLTSDITLYAMWQPQVCAISFNANGGALPSYTDAGAETGGARTRADNLRVVRKGDQLANNTNLFPLNAFRTNLKTSATNYVTRNTNSMTVHADATSSSADYIYSQINPYKNAALPSSANYTLVFEVVELDPSAKGFTRWLIAESNTSASFQSQFENTNWTFSTPSVGSLLAYATGRELVPESDTAPKKMHYLAHANTRVPKGQKGYGKVRISIFGGSAIALSAQRQPSQSPYSYVTPFYESIRCPLPMPVRTGHTFAGWYANSEGTGTRYTDDSVATTSLTLYAKWEPVVTYVSVSFDGNGSTGGLMESVSLPSNTSSSLPQNLFSRDGSDFIGWATSPTGDVIYADGAAITPSSDTTLYARWQNRICVVKFDANGGTITTYSDVGSESDGVRSRPDDMRFVPEGESLSSNANIFPANLPDNFSTRTSSITLSQNIFTLAATNTGSSVSYGQWTAKPIEWMPTSGTLTCVYEILDSDSAAFTRFLMSQNYTSGSISYQDQITNTRWIPPTGFTSGVFFAYANAKAITHPSGYTNNSYFGRANFGVAPNSTINARARIAVFAGSCITAATPQTGQRGYSYVPPFTGISCPLPTATRTGFSFGGWYDNPECIGGRYSESTAITSDKTLYALWENSATQLTIVAGEGIGDIYYAVFANLFSFREWRNNPNNYYVAPANGSLSSSLEGSGVLTIINTGSGNATTRATTTAGGANRYYSVVVEPGTQYTMSWNWTGDCTATRMYAWCYTDNTISGTYVSSISRQATKSSSPEAVGSGSRTFTTPDNCTAIIVRFGNEASGTTANITNINLYLQTPDYIQASSGSAVVLCLPGTVWNAYGIASEGYDSNYSQSSPLSGVKGITAETVTLTATSKTYQITFNPNGGVFEGRTEPTVKTVAYMSDSLSTIGIPTLQNKVFNGWYTTVSGSGELVYDHKGRCKKGTEFFDNEGHWIKPNSITLYARWTSSVDWYYFLIR